MKIRNNKQATQAVILGSLIAALILVIGTIWTGRSTSRDTDDAVRSVSLLYLDELAGRREQVVASTLEGYISDIDVAVSLLEKSDLESPENLQAYQKRMKQLYGLEKFAFVDETGLIYTSKGTRTDIDSYSFDYQTISEPEISLKGESKNNKKVVIAIPVDRLPFEGHQLLACFMEIDMENMLGSMSLQSDNNSTTFCNIYASDGSSFTNMVLGGLASEDNLLEALEHATFEKRYSLDEVRKDFSNRESGVISFTYNDITETLAYVPVQQTDWMLTYLIRESVISEEISTISTGIITRSLIQSGFTILVLITVFAILITQMRRAAKLTLEQETSDLMQQELEERIALQDELLTQEKIRSQQNAMITALASDYWSVYYVDLDEDEGICYRNEVQTEESVAEGGHFHFNKTFSDYANLYVTESYREAFLNFIKPENIRAALEKDVIIAIRYAVERDGVESYEMLRMAGVRHPDERDDNTVHAIGVGFTNIDAEMRDSMAKGRALSDALRTAEEASKAKTVFLSSMSHEIRTPMNAIISLDKLALHNPDLPESTKDYLEKIGTSAQHLLSLINDILDMSRIESGRMVIRNEEFALSKLLEQINIIISGQCQDKGLDYDCRIKGQLSDYYIGDSTKLRQVLINILGNAVKFTPEGGRVNFEVEKTAGFDKKTTIRFTISDTGIGMSKEYLPKVFDTFSQEDSGSTNKYGSSGLGMAITKNIVDIMNGNIEVESEQGKGTTFTVTVTLMDSDRKGFADGEEIEVYPQDMKVLVIDDDPIACDHAKLVLEQEGISTDTVMSGEEAVERIKLSGARQKPYNLIIVDWNMPGWDGVETTRRIRSIIGDESAIIILTAYNWDDILEEATEAGVDSFIAKPLFSGNLIEEFKLALKKKNMANHSALKKAELSGRRVLLAEDMEVNAEIMMEVLSMRDIVTEHAENGRVAVDMYSSNPAGYYDAILMDVRMPEMDGLEATMAIRGMDREDAKTIPIIALTANAFDEDVQRSLQAGLNAHLSKPVEPEVLFETLEQLIEP